MRQGKARQWKQGIKKAGRRQTWNCGVTNNEPTRTEGEHGSFGGGWQQGESLSGSSSGGHNHFCEVEAVDPTWARGGTVDADLGLASMLALARWTWVRVQKVHVLRSWLNPLPEARPERVQQFPACRVPLVSGGGESRWDPRSQHLWKETEIMNKTRAKRFSSNEARRSKTRQP